MIVRDFHTDKTGKKYMSVSADLDLDWLMKDSIININMYSVFSFPRHIILKVSFLFLMLWLRENDERDFNKERKVYTMSDRRQRIFTIRNKYVLFLLEIKHRKYLIGI
jgi:hypothetical protein